MPCLQPQELYEGKAVRRAIDEYLASGDRRIVPVLIRLLRHRETTVRGRAVEALGSFSGSGIASVPL